MSFNLIHLCHQTLILLSVWLLFTSSYNNNLCSAKDEQSSNTTDDGFFTVSSFSYPQATLRQYDFRYIRGLWSNSHWPFCLYVPNFLFLMFMKLFTVWILMGQNWILIFISWIFVCAVAVAFGFYFFSIVEFSYFYLVDHLFLNCYWFQEFHLNYYI